MKKVTLITVCIFAFTCNNSFSQQSKRTLAVPFHGQGYTYWCWAASAAMVLDYEFGQNNYVCTVVSNYLAIGGIYIDCCQFPALCNGGVSSTDIYNYLNRHTNYSFIKENRALEFDEIKELLVFIIIIKN